MPTMPEFKDEAEEARWWFENREALDAEFIAAAEDGKTGKGTVAKKAQEKPPIE